MVVARRDFDADEFDPTADLIGEMHDLTIIAMVGIVDPPRAEAKAAIAKCHSAGIEVRMITGDHAVTAAAIGKELGISGRALTGAEFAALTDEELAAQLPEIGVVARVAPEDKIRLVHALQLQSNIVAMTGDGVNDAPALKKADIGVAMGITGTEVSKDAAVMILTDDNFATIVRAVEYGRELYDNLSKYIRFQMAALVGFIATFLGAAIFSIADGIPFSPLAVLWINFVVQVPIAIALGLRQAPARASWTASRARWPSRCSTSRSGCGPSALGVLMAVATLWVRDVFEEWADALVATTMAVTVFSLMNVATRHERPQPDPHDLHPRHRLRPPPAHPLRRHDHRDRPRHRARRPQPDPRHDLAHRRPVARVPAAGRGPDRGRGDHQARPAPAGARHPRRRPMTPACRQPGTAAPHPRRPPRRRRDPGRPRRPAHAVVRHRRVRVAHRRRSSTPPPRRCSSGASSG